MRAWQNRRSFSIISACRNARWRKAESCRRARARINKDLTFEKSPREGRRFFLHARRYDVQRHNHNDGSIGLVHVRAVLHQPGRPWGGFNCDTCAVVKGQCCARSLIDLLDRYWIQRRINLYGNGNHRAVAINVP